MFSNRFHTIYVLIVSLFFVQLSYAQTIVKGIVQDKDGEALVGAHVQLKNTYFGTAGNAEGAFKLSGIAAGDYVLVISYIGYEDHVLELPIEAGGVHDLGIIQLEKNALMLDEFTVQATRVDLNDPMAYSNISKEQLEKNNLGQDLPYLLDQSPSVVVTSDAGAGVGYTGMRIRGSDPTRINVTINGVPLNDAESQGVWWVNMPDFVSSVDNIQIQRGVGSSSNGAGAFGASINLQSNTLTIKPYAVLSNSYGSFHSRKHTVQLGSGLINKHWTFEGRLSQISSDGYIDRSRSMLRSYYLSGAYLNEKTLIRANVFSGHERTYQAWGGVPVQYIDTNRTYNPYNYENEVDNYGQTHYQLHWNQSLGKGIIFNSSLHYTKGAGYYEQYRYGESLSDYGISSLDSNITDSDLIRRRWLDNDFYGVVMNLQYSGFKNRYKATLGGGVNRYTGAHFGQVIWARNAGDSELGHEYYRNDAEKMDGNVYYKMNFQINNKLNAFADLQYRYIGYRFLGYNQELDNVEQTADLHFFNPKAGLTFVPSSNQRAYISFAMGNREPNRDDYTQSTPESRPKYETLYDVEMGYEYRRKSLFAAANAYFMYYQNQLILTGAINDVGAYIRSNVPQSYRAGIELMAGWVPVKGLRWDWNATFSQNKIIEWTEFVDNWDTWGQEIVIHQNSDIAFSPSVIVGSEIGYDVINISFGEASKKQHLLNAAWISKYVGKQFIDNTANDSRSLPGYWVNDLRIRYTLKNTLIQELGINFILRNFLNAKYSSNAWVYRFTSPSYDPRSDDAYTNLDNGNYYNMIGLYPQAGINFMVGLDLKF